MPKKTTVKSPDWKTMDIEKNLRLDLTCAISLLQLINDKPEILRVVVQALEDFRANQIALESKPKS